MSNSFTESNALSTYLNPVYPKSFPDPFVLKFRGEYFAYCTGFAEDGRVFGVLRSSNLVDWTELGGAMEPLENSPPYYWAPEAIYDNGKFYLYYSVGNETLMELRVAVSDRPDGGFVDSGRRLTTEEFAIDAHVFVDDDGSRYLFYATDFLEHTHVGTGTVVDRMIDWFTLEGRPRPVTRAKYDWQVYDPQRKEKGGVRWHTVEGPAILKRKGIYYEMFSGGNWQNTSYGVSFAVSDKVLSDEEWKQFSDGVNVLPVLRTLPDIVIGPGHNSVVRGPNNRELYCVYHRWTDAGRVMAIDRMDFAGDRIFLIGPSYRPQPAPFTPASIRVDVTAPISTPPSFLAEISFSGRAEGSAEKFSIELVGAESSGGVTIDPTARSLTFKTAGVRESIQLPSELDWTSEHTLRIEADHRKLSLRLDSYPPIGDLLIQEPITSLRLVDEGGSVAIDRFDITEGFEELFETDLRVEENGWSLSGQADNEPGQSELTIECREEFILSKGRPCVSFEFAANVRVDSHAGEIGLRLYDGADQKFEYRLDVGSREIALTGETKELPGEIELEQYHQLRVVKLGRLVYCYFDDVSLGELPASGAEFRPAVYFKGVTAAVEMIRWTVI